jgi:hypothetical protein
MFEGKVSHNTSADKPVRISPPQAKNPIAEEHSPKKAKQ